MKKTLLFFLVFIIVYSHTWADPVDSALAKVVAANFYKLNGKKELVSIKQVYTAYNNEIPLYYVFDINSNDGFVIITADDDGSPVIGYSLNGRYLIENPSPEAEYWMNGYKNQIINIKTFRLKADNKIKDAWDKYTDTQIGRIKLMGDVHLNGGTLTVGPLLNSIWNQNPYYNERCPIDNASKKQTVTGCVATTMAQIMNYWKYPAHGTGIAPGYITNVDPISHSTYGLAAINLGNETFNWSKMPNQLTSTTDNSELAKLMLDCGVSVKMNYGIVLGNNGGSGAAVTLMENPVCAQSAYVQYFGYNSSTIKGLLASSYSTSDWITLLKNELNNKRPIQYVATDFSKNEGHTWVVDGYDNNNMFHMNWGWGGYYDDPNNTGNINSRDGSYSLDAINPGGDNFSVREGQKALIGIEPDCASADITPIIPSVSNSNPASGATVAVTIAENNDGKAYAGANIINIYLSTSSVLNASTADLLGQIPSPAVPGLSNTLPLSTSVTIPSNKSPGQYYLFFWADANQTVTECHDDNNFVSLIINVTSSSSCPKPQNDECTGSFNAVYVPFGTTGSCTSSVQGTSCGATASGFNACGGTNADDDVFFQFVPTTSNATITINPSAGYDPVFQLLTGPCGTNMQSVGAGCINNNGLGIAETQSYTGLVPGNTYFIRVWHAGTGSGSGNFSICVFGNSCISPGTPSSLAPGLISLPGETITTTTPNLNWTTVSGATAYVIRVMVEPYNNNNIVFTSGCLIGPPFTIPSGVLTAGGNYSWTVQALSSCGSNCATISANAFFSVNTVFCSPPSTQADHMVFSNIGTNQLMISWSNGNGDRRIVKINKVNSFSNPVNGVSVAANNYYSGSGEQVVFDGTSNSTYVYGLLPATSYCFQVYEANCTGTNITYNIASGNINNPLCQLTTTQTCSAPSLQSSNINFSNVGQNSIVLSWSNGNGNKRIVKMNTVSSFSNPADGTDPTASNFYTSGEQTVYNGSGSSITVGGLTANTNYCFRVFEGNCSGSSSAYNIVSGVSNTACQQTSTNCATPAKPITLFGNTICPGPSVYLANSVYIEWTAAVGALGISYDLEINEYPYNNSTPVYSQYCISGTNISIPASVFTAGKLYNWRVRSTADCNTCFSAWSDLSYFHIAPVIFGDNNISTCNGTGTTITTQAITVVSPGTVSYQWYRKGTGGAADVVVGSNSTSLAVTASGSYYVKIIYSGSTICTGTVATDTSIPIAIKIGAIPNAPSLNANSPACEGSTVQLTATASAGSVYYWSGPAGFSSSNSTIIFSTAASSNSGTYSCYTINIDGCQSATSSINLDIGLAPVASFITVLNGNSLSVVNNSTNADGYRWDFGDNQNSSLAIPTHAYATSGKYLVSLTVTKNNCDAVSYISEVVIGTSVVKTGYAIFAKLFHSASSTNKTWQAYDFAQSTVDSGFVCIGIYTNALTSDIVSQYFKIDKNSNVVWSRELPSRIGFTIHQIMKSRNGYILCLDNALMEIDELGNKTWGTQFSQYLYRFVRTGSNGYVGIGYIPNGNNFIKFDNNGNILWQKRYTYHYYNNTAISITDFAEDGDGNLVASGSLSDADDPANPNTLDGFILKLDANGGHVWSKYYSSAVNIQDMFTSMIVDNNNDIIVTGISRNNSINSAVGFITRLNVNGTIVYYKEFANNYFGHLIGSNASNNYDCIFSGALNNAYSVVSFSPTLAMLNHKEFDTRFYYAVKPTLDHKFAACGSYLVNSVTNDYRYNLFKFSYTDLSCLDRSASTFSTSSPFTVVPLLNLTAIPGTPTITASVFQLNSKVVTFDEVEICHNCDVVAAITTTGSLAICSGGTVTLSANADMNNYLWSNDKNLSSIAVVASGSYTVTVTDKFGCTATSTPAVVTVNPLPSATITGSTTICQNAAAPAITITGVGGLAPFTFTYTLNGVTKTALSTGSGNSVSIPVSTAASGVFTYTLVSIQESSSAKCSNSVAGSAVINITKSVTPLISINKPVCIADTTVFTIFSATDGGTAPKYQWQQSTDNINWNDIAGEKGTTLKLIKANKGTQVRCVFISNDPCATQTGVPSNIDTVNCVVTVVSSIDGLEKFVVTPNPNDGSFVIDVKMNVPKSASVQIFNGSGQMIYSDGFVVVPGSNKKRINLKKFASGVYRLVMIAGKQNYSTNIIIAK